MLKAFGGAKSEIGKAATLLFDNYHKNREALQLIRSAGDNRQYMNLYTRWLKDEGKAPVEHSAFQQLARLGSEPQKMYKRMLVDRAAMKFSASKQHLININQEAIVGAGVTSEIVQTGFWKTLPFILLATSRPVVSGVPRGARAVTQGAALQMARANKFMYNLSNKQREEFLRSPEGVGMLMSGVMQGITAESNARSELDQELGRLQNAR